MDSTKALRDWYTERSGLRVDLVGDFAGKELFAIHGEVLMAHCISQAKVNYQEGFQLLHAVYAVEKFLNELDQRHCHFQVIWLESHERLCIPPGTPEEHHIKYLLTRRILIEHLNRGLDAQRPRCSYVFDSLDDQRFINHLKSSPILFFLCSDGRQNLTAPEPTAPQNISMCLFLIYNLNLRGYSIALIDDAEISNAKVAATVFTPTHDNAIPFADQLFPEEDVGTKPDTKIVGEVAYQLLLKTDDWASWDDGTSLTARQALLVAALSESAQTNPDQLLIACVLAHMGLLMDHSLVQRASNRQQHTESQASVFLKRLLEISTHLIKKSAASDEKPFLSKLEWDAFDLFDGMLFYSVIGNTKGISLSQSTTSTVMGLSKKINTLSGLDCSSALKYLLSEPQDLPDPSVLGKEKDCAKTVAMHPVMKFAHPAFDKYFEDVKVDVNLIAERPIASKIFQEATHWHNSKKKLSMKQKPKLLDKWALKRNQRFTTATKKYADSLTTGTPENILVMDKSASSTPAPGWKEELRQKSSDTAKRLAMKKDTRGKVARGGILTAAAAPTPKQGAPGAAERLWATKKKELQKMTDFRNQLVAANDYESGIMFGKDLVGAEISLYICKLLVAIFDKEVKTGKGKGLAAIVEVFWTRVIELKTKRLAEESTAELNKLATALQTSTERARSQGLYHGATSIEHQLEFYGPDMERGFDPKFDPRVSSFNPDAWQRKVLDAIDAKKSLCVIAPTSAGKTFISFYAMKKVMQSSDNDVLVYVAPTKALVNQIAAEVQGRFKKKFRYEESRSVWAIHTRDYRVNNPTGCQILVTVPHILQIMLLSPPNVEKANSWAHRIKRIIFDEVHCIGQAQEGVVWEQLLLLAPCPIIALSATVGNPQEFVAWLSESQKTKGHDLELVEHKARYSDLRKYIYRPPCKSQDKFDGFPPRDQAKRVVHGLDEQGKSPFSFVHPIGSIVDRNRGTLDDISLEARDCLKLWLSMRKHQTEAFPVADKLDPSQALPAIVKKADILCWEEDLKACLLPWMMDPESPFESVRGDLRFCNNGDMQTRNKRKGEQLSPEHFQLLLDLHQRQGLPAIIFNYDRMKCESIMKSVISELKRHELEWKKTSKEWQKTIKDYEKWVKAQEKIKETKQGRKQDKNGLEEGMSKMDFVREEGQEEVSNWQSFDPQAPLAKFSFSDSRKCQREDLEELIRSLNWVNLDPVFIEALRRGVGVHHAGMNRKYRQVVEMLCRRGFLTVVIATGTLALGINVPCKTVVFSEDSVFLSALNYRQASGRAGRRGFDLLGNVVFNIPTHRSFEIMSSRLPDLRGQFPVSTTIVLRTLSLCSHTQNNEFSIQAAQSLLSQNLLYLGGPAEELAVKHHLRFSIEYLRKQHLLSDSGAPLNFAGLITHLYFTENSAFAFHSLLKGGYFHRLCGEVYTRPSAVVRELMLVLSHLFCRQPVTRIGDTEWLQGVKESSSSIVVLPDLPPKALDLLREHNWETLAIFKNYVQTYVCQNLADSPDDELPFSKYPAGSQGSGSHVSQTRKAPEIRSPFAALSGFTDSFNSIQELCQTVREGVFLEESAVPYIKIYPDDTDGVPWNAYLYDFFMHGDLKALVTGNGIKEGDVWFRLKDFSLILATIITSLDNFLDPKAGYPDMTDVQDVQDVIDRVAEDQGAVESDNIQPADIPMPLGELTNNKKTKRKKVAEAWDDDEDEDENKSADGYAAVNGSDRRTGVHNSDSETEVGWDDVPAWQEQDEANLRNILKAFKLLQVEFDEKFRKIWA
ncbi:DEAD/DEAH box helicase [Pyricularia oryzae]|uniref:DEAD/DEAH box helicase n=1 Tax=Pyricularia oryzae (strain P131) TaxID=1143193 RepID=L7JM61_PYRO1|nr:DEAD/DEAH box helicase [Pyricularia oryzae]